MPKDFIKKDKEAKKARLVYIEDADVDTRTATWEISKFKKGPEPLIIMTKVKEGSLTILGNRPFSEFINMEKIPKGYKLSRYESKGRSGVIFTEPGQFSLRIYYPAKYVGRIQNQFVESVKEVLKEDYEADVYLDDRRPHSNDIVFKKDDKVKKFCGMANITDENFFACVITLKKFDEKKIKDLYKLDHKKFTKKGVVKKVTDVIGGLEEVNKKIGDEVVEKILDRLCKKINWKIEKSEFTPEELAGIEQTKKVISNDDWRLRAKKPHKNRWQTKNSPNGQ